MNSCLIVSLLLLSWPGLAGAAPAKAAKKALPEGYDAFVASCSRVFAQRNAEAGPEICQCTARESAKAKIPGKVLATTASRIDADPKYRIEDARLLDQLQGCTIDILHPKSDEGTEK